MASAYELVQQMNAWLDGASSWSKPERDRWDREAMERLAVLDQANETLGARIAELERERDEALARLNHNRCHSGHETLPLKLWTCPTCFEIVEEDLEEACKLLRRVITMDLASEIETFLEGKKT